MALAETTYRHVRAAARDEVYFRAQGFGPDATALDLLIVNVSALGLMARCDGDYRAGQRIRVNLPIVGTVVAEIRWALGGRMGCELEYPIDRADYFELLAVMLRGS